MSTAEVSIDARSTIAELRNVAERVSLAPSKDELAQAVRDAFARAFETAGEYGGSAWAPLSAESARGHWEPLGEKTGTMWRSLSEEGAPGNFERLEADGQALEVGSDDVTADFFSRGTRRQPPRPFFVNGELPPSLVEQLEEIIRRHVEGTR